MTGDSAGATSIALLLVAFADEDPGLFKGVIMESVSVATIRTIEQGQEQYNCLSNATGCADAEDTLACMRGVDAEDLLTENCQFNPGIDNELITAPMLEQFAAGRYLKVPTIAGTCTDEGTKGVPQDTDSVEAALQFVNNQASGALSNTSLGLIQETYIDVNQPVFTESGRLWRQLANAHGDFRAHCITAMIQDAQARDGVLTWNYRYGVLDDEQEALGFGAYHTVELNGVFGPENTDGAPPESYATTNAPIVPLTMAYWASFVRTLDPNGAGILGDMPAWDPWTVQSRQRLLFQTDNTVMEMMPDSQSANCQMLGPMLPAIESPSSAPGAVELQRVDPSNLQTPAGAGAGAGAVPGAVPGASGTVGAGVGGSAQVAAAGVSQLSGVGRSRLPWGSASLVTSVLLCGGLASNFL
jgi:carboxylesterase type B